jgi:hypothetical protein
MKVLLMKRMKIIDLLWIFINNFAKFVVIYYLYLPIVINKTIKLHIIIYVIIILLIINNIATFNILLYILLSEFIILGIFIIVMMVINRNE